MLSGKRDELLGRSRCSLVDLQAPALYEAKGMQKPSISLKLEHERVADVKNMAFHDRRNSQP